MLVEHNLVKPEATGYLFAHALIQEGIYGSLLKSQQQRLHQRAADWFAKRDIVLYAEHLGRAGAPEAAGAYFAAACDQASQFRYETALRLIEKGLCVDPDHSTRHDLICLKGEVLQDLADVDASMAAYQTVVDHAQTDTQRCDGWMGLAAGMRLSTNYTGGLDLLVRAEPVAMRDGDSAKLARLHLLKGNLYFSLGRTNECRDEHGMALESARVAESVEDEVRALGGLGDAEYARGRMRTARDYLRECVEKCVEHGFGRVEVANRAQLGIALYYCGEWHEAQRESERAIRAAVQVGHQRAEMNARTSICFGFIEAGDWAAVEANVERGLELAKRLGARAWEPILLSYRAQTLLASGNRTEAMQILVDAERIQEEMDCSAFTAGDVYGGLVQAADDAVTREAMFAKGKAVVDGNSLAQVAFRLYRSAIDAFVAAANWDMVQRVADALERVTRDEPLGWSDFHIRRARILAATGRGVHDAQTVQELRTMCAEAEAAGRLAALPALKRAVP